MRFFRTLPIWSLSVFFVLYPEFAFADSATVGDMIANMRANMYAALPTFIPDLFYVVGILVFIMGIFKLAQNDRGNNGLASGTTMMLGGAALTILGHLLDTIVATIFNNGGSYAGGNSTVGAITSCTGSSLPLVCAAQNIATNVIPIATETAFDGCYFFAAYLFGTTLYKLAVSNRTGRFDPPENWVWKIIAAGVFANVPAAMTYVANTLGISSVIGTDGYEGLTDGTVSSLLAYTNSSNSNLAQFTQAISFIMVIISGFGVFYFISGVHNLMQSERSGKGGKGAAFWKMFGGVCMANCHTVATLILGLFGSNISL